MMKKLLTIVLFCSSFYASGQSTDSLAIRKIYDEALGNGQSYEWLRYLTQQIGPRLSGSDGAQKAVDWTKQLMEKQGFDRVFLQEVMAVYIFPSTRARHGLI